MSKHRKHSQNVTRAMTPSAPDTPISDALKETAPVNERAETVTPSTEGVLQCTAAGTAHECCASWDGYCHRVPGPHACCAPRGTMADRRNDDGAVPHHADADAPVFTIPTMGRIVWVRGANVRAADPDAWVPAIVVASDEKAGMIEVVAFGPSPCDVFARVMLDAMGSATWRFPEWKGPKWQR